MKNQKSQLNDKKQVQCKNLFLVENNSSRASCVQPSVPVRVLAGSRIPLRWLNYRPLQWRGHVKCVGKVKGACRALRFPEARDWRKLLLPGPGGTRGPVRAEAAEGRSPGGSSNHGRTQLQPETQCQSREGLGKKPSPVSLSCWCSPLANPTSRQAVREPR